MLFFRKASTVIRPAVVLALCIVMYGCIGLVPSPFRPSPGPQKAPDLPDLAQAFDIVCRNYRIGPDDSLRLIFQPEWNIPTGSFKLDTLDKIGIKFLFEPSLNEDVVIRPDGMITVQAIGDVKAAGMTPEKLARRIERKFISANIFSEEARAAIGDHNLVTVHVLDFYQKLAKLVEAFTTIAGGQQNAVLVNPDGTIDLPLLTTRVIAAGHTVPEVEYTVNRLYRQYVLKHARISLSLGEARSRKVFVMGAVASPGAYEIKQPVTALHAIAMAGGHDKEQADLTSVILISKNIHGKPIGRRLDLKRVLDVGDMSSAILVKPYDVVYVPKTYIQDVRIFMDQYVNTVTGVAELYTTLLGVKSVPGSSSN